MRLRVREWEQEIKVCVCVSTSSSSSGSHAERACSLVMLRRNMSHVLPIVIENLYSHCYWYRSRRKVRQPLTNSFKPSVQKKLEKLQWQQCVNKTWLFFCLYFCASIHCDNKILKIWWLLVMHYFLFTQYVCQRPSRDTKSNYRYLWINKYFYNTWHRPVQIGFRSFIKWCHMS